MHISLSKAGIFTVLLLLTQGSIQASPVQWAAVDGGNDHWYALIHTPGNKTFWQHKQDAEAMSHDTMPGYLVTITSHDEQQFVSSLLTVTDSGYAWMGLIQSGNNEPNGGWGWANGEPLTYTNWHPSEPNDSGGEDVGCLRFASEDHGTWNDGKANDPGYTDYFVVEFDERPEPPAPAVPTPSSLLAGIALVGTFVVRRGLRSWKSDKE